MDAYATMMSADECCQRELYICADILKIIASRGVEIIENDVKNGCYFL